MANKLHYTIFETPLGWMGILAGKDGLLAVTLPQPTRQQVIDAFGEKAQGAVLSHKFFGNLPQEFLDYYSGRKTALAATLDYSHCTPFQKQVWEAACSIPPGETRSYGWIAKKIGNPKAARAVGGALHNNPFPVIVPCHRVIASDGHLGGFGGGLEMKQKLLNLEKTSSH
jgi:methylated-DNA-[protein]-cysteine S-methyltransferase